jgi:hypothetical protein
MLAHVVTTAATPEVAAASIDYLRDTVTPLLRRQAGYQGTFFLLDRETGKALTIDLWASEADHRSAEALYASIEAQARRDYNIPEDRTIPVDTYEVALTP